MRSCVEVIFKVVLKVQAQTSWSLGSCAHHWRTFLLILASPCQNVSTNSRRACVHVCVRDDLVTCATV